MKSPKKQMKAGGNVVAFEIIGGIEAGRNFLDKKKLCSLSPNLETPERLLLIQFYNT
jgi:cystathionine beta-lyase/cystathionine gamma-synthase